jgi:hypothetical protein
MVLRRLNCGPVTSNFMVRDSTWARNASSSCLTRYVILGGCVGAGAAKDASVGGQQFGRIGYGTLRTSLI